MQLKQVKLHQIRMKLNAPFVTSYGAVQDRESIIVEMEDDQGVIGWGECVAFSFPWYTEETLQTCRHMMADFLIPILFQQPLAHPDEVRQRFLPVRRNQMAKAALEGAVWDVYAKHKMMTLSKVIGGEKEKIDVGVAIGIRPLEMMLDEINNALAEGYKRIKVKIKPGLEHELLGGIRKHFPNLPLMADANSAYCLDDIDLLKSLDEYQLMMIEQPLGVDDLVDHAKLQKRIKTPVCLDESIVSYECAQKAVELGSCKVINIKTGRVGGISEAKRIHDLCQQNDIALWGGGMLEAGVARAHSVAIASLPYFTLPADTAGSSRYWEQDIIEPEVTVHQGAIHVSNQPGLGYHINRNRLEAVTVQKTTFIKDK
ncbi:MAG: o-succinylbenzoate synthase [Syntrophomonadaceae bacterium]|nr:o-succinylbenzoate synthase [Syntrophomonadaceae bacterium]